MTNLIRRRDIKAVIIQFENGEQAMIDSPSQPVFTCDTNFYTKGKGSPVVTDKFLEYSVKWTEREGESGVVASNSHSSNS